MSKIIWKLIGFLFLSIFIVGCVGGAFYWYSVRPIKIRKECSWVERVQSNRVDRPRDELSEGERKILEDSPESKTLDFYLSGGKDDGTFDTYWKKYPIGYRDKLLYKYESITYWGSVSDEEYSVCLRQKGLVR